MKHNIIIVTVGLALAAMLSAVPAQAQLQHTFVSSKGSDANNCSLAAPCRHLQTALAATLAGGEILILDSAGYNNATTVTINKAISIVAPPGIEAEIAPPSGGHGIAINAGANDAVSLRGLTIDGAGVGGHGIAFISGKSLTINNCVVRNMGSSGIGMSPSTDSKIVVSNTVVADNANHGIYVQPIGQHIVSALFNHVEAYNNGGVGIGVYGNFLDAGYHVEAKAINSAVAYNGTAGFLSYGGGSARGQIVFYVYHSSSFGNVDVNNLGTGMRAENFATMFIGQSDSDSWSWDSTSLQVTFGDNDVNSPAGIIIPRN